MIKKLKEFDRKDFFDYYNNSCDNSFLSFTIKLDVTKIAKFAKKHKTSFYATMGYLLTKAINNVDNFKYRYFEGEFYYCDKIRANYTQIKDGEVAFFGMPDIENYYEYIKTYKDMQRRLFDGEKFENKVDEFWVSCTPWFKFNSVVVPFDKDCVPTQFLWDKFEKRFGKYTVNFMLMAHHGFIDGYHVSLFLEELKNIIKNFKKYL